MSEMQDAAAGGAGRITLRRALVYYGAAALVMALIAGVVAQFESPPLWLLLPTHVALGIALNRIVLRRLIQWHPVYNTLQNVASEKLRMLLLWPLSYPVLFFQLGVSKYL